jgi:pimeloyl-ACP methyl ester carboxylesterase
MTDPQANVRPTAIYLAGGLHSHWQDDVIRMLAGRFRILDPRSHGLSEPGDYTLWDLNAIRESDYVLAFMESTNPGGFALALEAGFAHALGKPIVLVNEVDQPRRKYFAMVETISSHVFPNLGAAIDFFSRMEPR